MEGRVSAEQFYKVCDVVQHHMQRWEILRKEHLIRYVESAKLIKIDGWHGGWQIAYTHEDNKLVDDLGKDIQSIFKDCVLTDIHLSRSMCMNKRFARSTCRDLYSSTQNFGVLNLGYEFGADKEEVVTLLCPTYRPDMEIGPLPELDKCKELLKECFRRGWGGSISIKGWPNGSVEAPVGFPKKPMNYLLNRFRKVRELYGIELFLPDVTKWNYSKFYCFSVEVPNNGYKFFVYPEVRKK